MAHAWRWVRSLVFVGQMYVMMLVIGLLYLPGAILSPEGARRGCKAYCRWVFWTARWMVGLRCEVRGTPPTEGALVDSSSGVLATIQQLDPVYADFTQSANQLLSLRRSLQVGSLTGPSAGEAAVQLKMDDGQEYPHKGRLLFSEAAVDATTGQITLRGEFPNPDGDLLPGMYVRVLIEQGIEQNALAVPQQAVQRNAGGQAQVYVVGADDKAELRSVETGRIVGTRWVISKGLSAGDKVIVEGFQKLRPGAPVAATPWEDASKTAAVAAS
jgi:membrane fusion protein (multidrug efflux system)